MFINILAIFGLIALGSYLYDHLSTPIRLLLKRIRSPNRPTLKERFGSWAAITGSSDGIGKAYAQELAKHGINVVLIARNEQKLQSVAAEITSKYDVKVKIIVADFTKGAAIYEHIESKLNELPVTILVNNVGIGKPGRLHKLSVLDTQNLIDTNVMAVSQLSRYFIHRLIATKLKGALVNVGSGTDMQPLPHAALYAASKVYTRYLTLALKSEAAPYGIHVQMLAPDFVVTKINSYSRFIMKGGLFIPTAEQYARSAVEQLRDGIYDTPGYLWHHVQNAIIAIIPFRMRIGCTNLFFKYLVQAKK